MPVPFNTDSSAKAREASDQQRGLYKRDFLDDDHWKELAKDSGVSLPPYYTRPSDSAIKATLRKLKISWDTWVEAFGWENAEQFEKMNPMWSMRPLTGLILELWAEREALKQNMRGAAQYRGIQTGVAQPKDPRYPQGVAKAKRKPIAALNQNQHANN